MTRSALASAVLMVLCVCPLQAQAPTRTMVDITTQQPGTYLLTVTATTATIEPLRIIGSTPPPPPLPADLTERGKAVRDAALTAKDELTSAKLAAAFRMVADKITAGDLKSAQAIGQAVKMVHDAVIPATGTAAWKPYRDVVTAQFTKASQEGATDGQHAAWLQEVSKGLEATVTRQQAIDLEMLLKLIQMILEILKQLFPRTAEVYMGGVLVEGTPRLTYVRAIR